MLAGRGGGPGRGERFMPWRGAPAPKPEQKAWLRTFVPR
jgi:hypothetical protein